MRPVARPFVPMLAAALAAGALVGCDALALLGGIPAPRVTVAAPLPGDLPYRDVIGGLVLLSGRVNDVADIAFVLDTGAPISVLIDGERTAALKLEVAGVRLDGLLPDYAQPAGTSAVQRTGALGVPALAGWRYAVDYVGRRLVLLERVAGPL